MDRHTFLQGTALVATAAACAAFADESAPVAAACRNTSCSRVEVGFRGTDHARSAAGGRGAPGIDLSLQERYGSDEARSVRWRFAVLPGEAV